MMPLRPLGLLALALLGLAGCRPARPPVSLSSGGPSWFRAADKPVPGIDSGSAGLAGWNGENVFVVWTDTNGSASNGHTTDRGASYSGHFVGKDGRKVEYRCDTADGKTGVLTLDGRDYDLGQGTLFLVSTTGPQTRVLQLRRDVRMLKMTPEVFWKLAEDDKEIAEFFGGKAP